MQRIRCVQHDVLNQKVTSANDRCSDFQTTKESFRSTTNCIYFHSILFDASVNDEVVDISRILYLLKSLKLLKFLK